MKTFKIDESTTIQCHVYETRNSWGHVAKLMNNGREVSKCRIRYYNRTWESFEFESVISNLLHKTQIIPNDQIKNFLNNLEEAERREVDQKFGLIAGIAQLGDLFCDNQKDKNDWKERMIKAGLGDGLIMPNDWGTLNEQEKENRLNLVINELNK